MLHAFATGFGLLLLGAVPPASAAVVDRAAAVVNDDVIAWSEVYELGSEHIETAVKAATGSEDARRKLELEVLDALIDRHLVEQEMSRLNLDVDDTEIDRAVGDIARQNGLDKLALRKEVEKSGLTWENYQTELAANLREMKFNQQVLGPRISVHDDEIADYYKRNQGVLSGPARVRIQAVYVPYAANVDDAGRKAVLERVVSLRGEIEAGKGFDVVAREASAEPFASRGGDMGTFEKGQLMAELDGPAFSLPLGALSDPIPTPQGVFVLRIAEKGVQPPPPLEEIKDQLRQKLMEEKVGEAREQWLAQARRRSTVKVLLEPAGAPVAPSTP